MIAGQEVGAVEFRFAVEPWQWSFPASVPIVMKSGMDMMSGGSPIQRGDLMHHHLAATSCGIGR